MKLTVLFHYSWNRSRVFVTNAENDKGSIASAGDDKNIDGSIMINILLFLVKKK